MHRLALTIVLIVAASPMLGGCDCDGNRATVPSPPPERDPEAHARCVAALGAVRSAVDAIHESARERAGSGEAAPGELRIVGDACREIRVQLGLAETASRLSRPTASDAFDLADAQVVLLPDASQQEVAPLMLEARRACP